MPIALRMRTPADCLYLPAVYPTATVDIRVRASMTTGYEERQYP